MVEWPMFEKDTQFDDVKTLCSPRIMMQSYGV